MIADEAIGARARQAGLVLSPSAAAALATHARMVLAAAPRIHLTAITDPAEMIERHVGESLEGAALLPADTTGVLLDLGSGNGYPGIPVGLARDGLRVVLAEASERKARFLEEVAAAIAPGRIAVLHAQVQRTQDLGSLATGGIAVVTTRAMGNWARVLPRLLPALGPGGRVLLWAGTEVEGVIQRAAWRGFRVQARRALPGRARSWVWELVVADEHVGMNADH